MSGHSKWATIKHAKGAADAKRGQLFTKFIKEISIAARMGGGDPNSNPRLRTAILKARASNMPKDNIERAIKKGTGELGGSTYEEKLYEGYGPGGVAVLVEVLTDNNNRAAANVRNIFGKSGGNLGATGSVAYMFNRKGVIEYSAENIGDRHGRAYLRISALQQTAQIFRDQKAGNSGASQLYDNGIADVYFGQPSAGVWRDGVNYFMRYLFYRQCFRLQ